MLQVSDVLGLAVAFVLTQYLFGEQANLTEVRGFLLMVPLWIGVATLYGLYERDQQRTAHSTVDDLASISHMAMVCVWLSFGVAWVAGLASPTLTHIAAFWLLSVFLVTTGRGIARGLAHRSPTYVQRAVIVGAGDVGQAVARKLTQHPEYCVTVVGFVDSEPKDHLVPGIRRCSPDR